MKEEESANKHEKYDSAVSEVEISPSFVDSPVTAGHPRRRNVARIKFGITCIFITREKAPSHYTEIRIFLSS